MTECINAKRLSRYYDHELSPERRIEFEKHVESCSRCRENLESYAHVSRVFASHPMAELSGEKMSRLHAGVSPLRRNGLRTVAKALASAAVFLLIAGGVFAWQPGGASISRESLGVDLVEATGTIQAEETELADAETEFAEWMVVTLSQGDGDD